MSHFDRLSAALCRNEAEPPADPLDADEAEREVLSLVEEAERGEHNAWQIRRAIALAARFPALLRIQRAAARLSAIQQDAETAKACARGVLERFPASPDAFAAYLAAIARADGDAAAARVFAAYFPELDRLPAGAEQRAAAGLEALGRRDEAAALLGLPMREEPPSAAALSALLDAALDRRRAHPPVRPTSALGSIVLIGGTLGGGGAERQLVNTALALQSATTTSGSRVLGPVIVACRKLNRRRAHDFHLPALQTAGIRVIDYLALEPDGGDRSLSRAGAHADLVALLPDRMREGVAQLVEFLRHEAPDVVQIWQDGMIHAAGLAALVANVPRIVLNVRTMPPTARADRLRPESAMLYRRLVDAPGTTLSANSAAAARAYEAWLGLSAGAVFVIPNGVSPPAIDADDEAVGRWRAFDDRTGPGFVLGGAMRLDDNKRPLEWLEIAAALAQRLPDARFVLVGSGPLRAAVEDHARLRGLAERSLLVGRSRSVGFWLSKMDALALTSRHEGLPNVLIEAQLLGLPVVATPAGGAADAVAPLSCNLILEHAATVDRAAAAAHLVDLASRPPIGTDEHAARLRHWAAARFSIEAMAERTIDLFG